MRRMLIRATTILSRNPSKILSALTTLHSEYKDYTLLFTLSSNAATELSELVGRLTTFSKSSVGCLSHQLPAQDDDSISCSLAFFDPKSAIPFRSNIPGRPPIQVGRWHSFEKPQVNVHDLKENLRWEDVWNNSLGNQELPQALQTVKPDEIKTVVFLTDDAPEGLLHSFKTLPGANKLGLIASPTPFVTGRPFTLFSNEKIHSSGAVGIALTNESGKLNVRVPTGMKSITGSLIITNSEGNLVHELDKSNPTRLLLAAIDKAGIENAKENEFYILMTNDGAQQPYYQITSGDPSRGTLSLESHAEPCEGAQVELCYMPLSSSLDISPVDEPSIQFLALSGERQTGARVGSLSKAFLAGSENGFLVGTSRAVSVPWKCTVAGGTVTLS